MKAKQDSPSVQKRNKIFEGLNTEQYRDLLLKEQEKREKEKVFFEKRRIEEKIVWTAEQEKIAAQIKDIQEALKKLINTTKGLNRELKTAATQTIVEPSVYQVNFLQRLLNLIQLFRKKLQDSQTWLAEWNTYCRKKRNYYWIQVKKSGTSFMLSSERYLATQTG